MSSKTRPRRSIAACWRDTDPSVIARSHDGARPITRRSPSKVIASPARSPPSIVSRIVATAAASVIKDRHDVDQRERPHPPGQRDVGGQPYLEQIVVTQLRIERDLDLLLAEDQPHRLAEVFLLGGRDLLDNQPQA